VLKAHAHEAGSPRWAVGLSTRRFAWTRALRPSAQKSLKFFNQNLLFSRGTIRPHLSDKRTSRSQYPLVRLER
jgi:hypothetical protein